MPGVVEACAAAAVAAGAYAEVRLRWHRRVTDRAPEPRVAKHDVRDGRDGPE